jgi:lantibiotic modifying enzyme
MTGFSHGAAGIGWALARYAAAADDARCAELARAAFAYERTAFDPVIGNWPNFRMTHTGRSTAEASTFAWCHGAPGIGLARLDVAGLDALGNRATDPQLAADIDLALRGLAGAPPATSHGLCHGELGNLELFTAAIRAGHEEYREHRARRAAGLLDALERNGPVCATPRGVTVPGLMIGLAGIGHGLLRLAFDAQVPAALLPEPPRPDTVARWSRGTPAQWTPDRETR